ncbi:MAG: integrase [Pseudomonadota bacterium]
MGKQEKRAYLDAIRARYRRAKKAGKTTILNEFCEVCGYHRKYALRLLGAPFRRAKTPSCKPGPTSRYETPELIEALRTIWLASDQLCSKRLKAALPLWLPHYALSFRPLSPETQGLLNTISAATIDRLLKPIRAKVGRRGLSGTKPGTLLKKQIPIQTGVWDITQPGFIEADTVAHCGDSLAGDFVRSLTMTDLCTGWTECRATWNKGADGVMTQIKAIQKALPFPVRGFDCDNGSEFLNHHLLRYFQNHKQPVQFTRSRPYHSNDNAHVEQKNWSHVRQLFGYDRFADPKLVKLMNDLYANEFSLFTNFFCPTLKLVSKARDGSKWIRKYSKPITPAQRLIDHLDVSPDNKIRLAEQTKSINPFDLQKRLQGKLKAIFKRLR